MPEIVDVIGFLAHVTPLHVDRSENVLAAPSYAATRERPTPEVVATYFTEVLATSPLEMYEMRYVSIQKIPINTYVPTYAAQKRPFEGHVRETNACARKLPETHG